VPQDFNFRFLHDQFPQAPDNTIRAVSIFFQKFEEIFAAQGTSPESLTPVANGKNLQSENFSLISFGLLWVVELTYRQNFSFKFTLSFQQSYIVPINDTGGKFADGIVYTCGKFATGIKNTSRTVGQICRRYRWYDTSGAPWLVNISKNFRKIRNDPGVIFRGLGEDDSWKKSEAKNLVTLSL
jgi:hypothetical protein